MNDQRQACKGRLRCVKTGIQQGDSSPKIVWKPGRGYQGRGEGDILKLYPHPALLEPTPATIISIVGYPVSEFTASCTFPNQSIKAISIAKPVMRLRIIEVTMLNWMTFWASCISSARFINMLDHRQSSRSGDYAHRCDQRHRRLDECELEFKVNRETRRQTC